MKGIPKLSKEQTRVLDVLIDGGEIEERNPSHIHHNFVYLHNEHGQTEMIQQRTFDKLCSCGLLKKRENGRWR